MFGTFGGNVRSRIVPFFCHNMQFGAFCDGKFAGTKVRGLHEMSIVFDHGHDVTGDVGYSNKRGCCSGPPLLPAALLPAARVLRAAELLPSTGNVQSAASRGIAVYCG